MKEKPLIIWIVLMFCANWSFSQNGYWQQELTYDIDVKLNDQEKTLDGFLKLSYKNNSPDTLQFIYFHLWPNAFRNDRTAFSEQMLENGRTDFYFSSQDSKGYINRLDFRTGNQALNTVEDPINIDLVKVYLNQPLLPGNSTQINTPFHVKLPFNFSRGGFNGNTFQVTQWYPSPAVYDKNGWHPMPYLDQGEFYSEFGKFKVQITVPSNYVVAATGDLQNQEELEWLKTRRNFTIPVTKPLKTPAGKKPVIVDPLPSSAITKTLIYEQDKIHDFAWFADKSFIVNTDTIQLASGETIQAFSYYHSNSMAVWNKSIQMMRDAIQFRSLVLGPYPFKTVSALEANMGFPGGMEYPTITSISPMNSPEQLESVIEHEIGHNWFQGILASNERQHPWLDEGFNTYYDLRYNAIKHLEQPLPAFLKNLIPESPERMLVNIYAAQHKDQPIISSSSDFNFANYNMVGYYKTAFWMQSLETKLGRARFDSLMQAYYQKWKFRHPQPEDFIEMASKSVGTDWLYFEEKLFSKGPIDTLKISNSNKPALFISLSSTNQPARWSILPLAGYNTYDGIQGGMAAHNFNLPPTNFRYFIAATYGLKSNRTNLLAKTQYTLRKNGSIEKANIGLSFFQYSTQSGVDSNGKNIYKRAWRLTPSLKLWFHNPSYRSSLEKYLEYKTFLIGELGFKYKYSRRDSSFHPYSDNLKIRYLNQLTFSIINSRVLYPYDLKLQLQQGEKFYRASINANYFLNYAGFGGANIRFFAAKFGYLGNPTTSQKFETFYFQPKLTANRGDEDYTYSNYFIGRNEQDGLGSQQILNRDGNLHLRTDLFQGLQGRSENWVAAINMNTSLPTTIIPNFLPMKLFLDLGTHAEAWKKGYNQSRFLYVGGIQFSLLKNLLNIYVPIVYSSEFSDQLKTVAPENKFGRKISFSIDLQSITFQNLFGKTILP